MSEAKRRHFSGAEKVQILKRHWLDKVPVSDLCDEYKRAMLCAGLRPTAVNISA
jgi:hypothetical protein